ncbi:glycosyl hydrolase family 18 protein [Neolewinella lacunae]|uniref:chitinase n=1 Tax=Neolewinella lacunae TaxID=1517758 RepID=A0A923TAN5_9BACT|nr:glycosyl hydrolase family 18 protein [Neolewinella lacunae]MBC6996669.1 hypothetical protein [Neolewinella lacunae]MDN3634766.1 glycosyl hydrolase family 18 protein [Neolewinella lacunae]
MTVRYCLFLLCCSLWLSLPAQEAAEKPGYLERFLAIFQRPAMVATDTFPAPPKAEADLKERYALIYNLIHREEQAYYQALADSSATFLNSIQNLDRAKYISPDGDTVVLAKNVRVFGWHPHWMGEAYRTYNFKLLSHVSLFSYNINTGPGLPYDNPEVIAGWEAKDFELVKLAQADDCKVMLTITNFGIRKNQIFLSDPVRQERMIEDVVALLVRLGADGIDVDFELIPDGYERQFSAFIRRLRTRLAAGQQRYQLSVVLPKVNQGPGGGSRIYNIDTLSNYVDFFTLTAYDFTTGGYAPGPIAPLYNPDGKRRRYGSIEDVVFNYLEAGLPREKLLLGLPYYGGKWSSLTSSTGLPDTTLFEHLTFGEIQQLTKRLGPPEYTQNTWAARYQYQSFPTIPGYDVANETLWFDDRKTLEVKYDWVLQQGLGGIGIWAMGYDLPEKELWSLIDEKFAPSNDTLVHYQTAQSTFYLPAAILRYRDPIGITGLFVFLFLAVGFVWALFDWRVRDVFFQHQTLRGLYITAAFSLITATFAFFLFLNPSLLSEFGAGSLALLALVVGMVLGPWLTRVITRWFNGMRKTLP